MTQRARLFSACPVAASLPEPWIGGGRADRRGLRARALAVTAKLRLGDPVDPTVDISPMISAEVRDRVVSAVSEAVASGAQLLSGGVPVDVDHYAPTLLLTRDPAARIVQEETFGPVAVIQPATDLEHALARANRVEQRLVLAVRTRAATAAASVLDRAANGEVVLRFMAQRAPQHLRSGVGLPSTSPLTQSLQRSGSYVVLAKATTTREGQRVAVAVACTVRGVTPTGDMRLCWLTRGSSGRVTLHVRSGLPLRIRLTLVAPGTATYLPLRVTRLYSVPAL